MHIVESLAEFAALSNPVKHQPALKQSCRTLLADLVAAAAAGAQSDLAQAAWQSAQACYGPGGVSVWFRSQPSSVVGAAMANSAAASALDLDDGHRGAAGHPGAGVIPAALAMAQVTDASDDEVFNAILVGYDVALRIATARPFATIDTWASGRWVGYGVAAAAARLMRLDAVQTAHALAIAGAEGPVGIRSGTSKYQGSSVKEQIPAAVVAGITAAYRASVGATGPLDLLDDPDRYNPEILLDDLAGKWWLEDCYLKPYACCRYMHAAIDAIDALRDRRLPIVSLEIQTFPRGLGLSNEKAPRTLEGAQYSYYFSCAVAAIHGSAALLPCRPELLQDHAVLDLAQRIVLSAHADFSDAFPRGTPCRVLLDQGKGVQTMTVDFPLGDVSNPMQYEQVLTKFRRLTEGNLDSARQQAIIDALDAVAETGFQPLLRALA